MDLFLSLLIIVCYNSDNRKDVIVWDWQSLKKKGMKKSME